MAAFWNPAGGVGDPSGPLDTKGGLQVSDERDWRADEIVRLREELSAARAEIEQLRGELEELRHRKAAGDVAAEFDHMRVPPSTSMIIMRSSRIRRGCAR